MTVHELVNGFGLDWFGGYHNMNAVRLLKLDVGIRRRPFQRSLSGIARVGASTSGERRRPAHVGLLAQDRRQPRSVIVKFPWLGAPRRPDFTSDLTHSAAVILPNVKGHLRSKRDIRSTLPRAESKLQDQ
jgi:hypothetical protein